MPDDALLFCVLGPIVFLIIMLGTGGKMRGPRIGDDKRSRYHQRRKR